MFNKITRQQLAEKVLAGRAVPPKNTRQGGPRRFESTQELTPYIGVAP
jgi:hypothetical protein